MNVEALRAFYDRQPAESAADPRWAEAHAALLLGLESGEVRAAEPLGEEWQVNAWVKQGILAAFRATKMVEVPGPGFPFMDKTAFPARVFSLDDAVLSLIHI